MIPTSHLFDQSVMTALLDNDPVVQHYRTFFSLLDWSPVEQWQAQRPSRGRPAHPESAYLKAFLIRQCEGMLYTSQLRRFLLKHPLLVIEIGFHLALDPQATYGFDVERTLPCRYWFTQKLHDLDPALLQDLFHGTVAALHDAFPDLGETVAFDVKHIYAWVKENNPRVFVTDRYDKERILKGDPDCKLGVKRSSNQTSSQEPTTSDQEPSAQPPSSDQPSSSQSTSSDQPSSSQQPKASSKETKEYLWGYGSGVAAAIVPGLGDVVLAEYTQPFNENDVTYFRSLYERAVLALDRFPTNITADAAFDAWYVYECAARHGGIAAVPLNSHGHPDTKRDLDAVPICREGLRMIPTFQFNHPNGYRAQRFCCPLLVPQLTGALCDHPQFLKGVGCCKDPNWEAGGRMRVTLDRDSDLYKDLYRQRTSCERINSQAQALGGK